MNLQAARSRNAEIRNRPLMRGRFQLGSAAPAATRDGQRRERARPLTQPCPAHGMARLAERVTTLAMLGEPGPRNGIRARGRRAGGLSPLRVEVDEAVVVDSPGLLRRRLPDDARGLDVLRGLWNTRKQKARESARRVKRASHRTARSVLCRRRRRRER